jgi:hypothetical protein
MHFAFTEHAKHALKMRNIDKKWVVVALEDPESREKDPNDKELERFYKRVPECENRVLRVVVNTKLAPWRIVSVFFDRRMKGKL